MDSSTLSVVPTGVYFFAPSFCLCTVRKFPRASIFTLHLTVHVLGILFVSLAAPSSLLCAGGLVVRATSNRMAQRILKFSLTLII